MGFRRVIAINERTVLDFRFTPNTAYFRTKHRSLIGKGHPQGSGIQCAVHIVRRRQDIRLFQIISHAVIFDKSKIGNDRLRVAYFLLDFLSIIFIAAFSTNQQHEIRSRQFRLFKTVYQQFQVFIRADLPCGKNDFRFLRNPVPLSDIYFSTAKILKVIAMGNIGDFFAEAL